MTQISVRQHSKMRSTKRRRCCCCSNHTTTQQQQRRQQPPRNNTNDNEQPFFLCGTIAESCETEMNGNDSTSPDNEKIGGGGGGGRGSHTTTIAIFRKQQHNNRNNMMMMIIIIILTMMPTILIITSTLTFVQQCHSFTIATTTLHKIPTTGSSGRSVTGSRLPLLQQRRLNAVFQSTAISSLPLPAIPASFENPNLRSRQRRTATTTNTASGISRRSRNDVATRPDNEGTTTTTTTEREMKQSMLSTTKREQRKRQLSQQDYQLEASMMNHDLLSKEQEYELSNLYHTAKQLQEQIDTILQQKNEQQQQAVATRNENIKDMNDDFDFVDDTDDMDDEINELYAKSLEERIVATQPVSGKKKRTTKKVTASSSSYTNYMEYQQLQTATHRIQERGQLLQRLDQSSRTTMATLLFNDEDDDSRIMDIDDDNDLYDTGINDSYYATTVAAGSDYTSHAVNDLSEQDIIESLHISGGRAELEYILLTGAQARDTLICSNLRLVSSICKKWAKMSSKSSSSDTPGADSYFSIYSGGWDRPSLSEAIQEGVIGLTTAAERFDPSRGLRFSTYATFWITNSVRQCFQRSSTGCLKLPMNYYEIRTRFKTLVRKYYEMDLEVPAMDVLAREMRLSEDRLQFILRVTQPLLSVDGLLIPRGAMTRAGQAGNINRVEDGILLSDTLADTNYDSGTDFNSNPVDRVELSFLRQQLEQAMAVELVPFERDVLRLRLGLDDGVTRTCREVAIVCGGRLKSSEIRTVERRALKKLRSPVALATYKLLTYLDFADIDVKTISLQ